MTSKVTSVKNPLSINFNKKGGCIRSRVIHQIGVIVNSPILNDWPRFKRLNLIKFQVALRKTFDTSIMAFGSLTHVIGIPGCTNLRKP